MAQVPTPPQIKKDVHLQFDDQLRFYYRTPGGKDIVSTGFDFGVTAYDLEYFIDMFVATVEDYLEKE